MGSHKGFIRTLDGVEEMSAGLREDTVNYIQRSAMENHCCSSYYLAYAICKRGVGRQHRTFTSCQNAACSKIFFLQRVDCD